MSIIKRKAVCGIYCIENKITGKKYIGQSVDCWRRINEHCSRKNLLIDRIVNQYGVENFNFSVIKRCGKSMLTFWEEYYIHKYNTYYNGYNEKVITKYQERFNSLKERYNYE